MKRKIDYEKLYSLVTKSHEKLFTEYEENVMVYPESEKWDYAIPENYTNYQDGFLWEDCEAYRGKPLINHPVFGTLYLRWLVPYSYLKKDEKEKYLCFDRRGRKYTVIFTVCDLTEGGNPSYFKFLPRVKKYKKRRST